MDQQIFIQVGTCEFPVSLCFKNTFKTHKELRKLNMECKRSLMQEAIKLEQLRLYETGDKFACEQY